MRGTVLAPALRMFSRLRSHKLVVTLLLAVAPLFCAPFVISAQTGRPRVSAAYLFRPGNITLTVSGGGAAFTDFQQTEGRLTTGPDDGAEMLRRVSARTTGTVSAGLTVWVSPSLGINVAGGYTPTRFRLVTQGPLPPGAFVNAADTAVYARLRLWDASANVLLRPPTALGRVYPYAILGGGVLRYAADETEAPMPPEAHPSFSAGDVTRAMATLGVGAVIPLQRKHVLLAFDITDRLSRTPIPPHDRTFGQTSDGAVTLMAGTPSARQGGITLSNNLRFTVGLTVPLRLH